MTEEDIADTPHADFYDIGYTARIERNWQLLLQLRRRVHWNMDASLSIYIEFVSGWRNAQYALERQGDLFA